MEEPGEVREVEFGCGDVCACEHTDSGRRSGGQLAWQRHNGQRLRIALVEPGKAGQVVGLEILNDARIIDGLVPLEPGLIRSQPMQHLRSGFHTPTLACPAPPRDTWAVTVPTASDLVSERFLRPPTTARGIYLDRRPDHVDTHMRFTWSRPDKWVWLH